MAAMDIQVFRVVPRDPAIDTGIIQVVGGLVDRVSGRKQQLDTILEKVGKFWKEN